MEQAPNDFVDDYIRSFQSKQFLGCLSCQLFRNPPEADAPPTAYVYPMKQCLGKNGGIPYRLMQRLVDDGLMESSGKNDENPNAPAKRTYSIANSSTGQAFARRLRNGMPQECDILVNPPLPSGVIRAIQHGTEDQLGRIIAAATARLVALASSSPSPGRRRRPSYTLLNPPADEQPPDTNGA